MTENLFNVSIKLQGLFRLHWPPGGPAVALAPPTTSLPLAEYGGREGESDTDRFAAFGPFHLPGQQEDLLARELAKPPHEFYVQWDPRETRASRPAGGLDRFPAALAIWNCRGSEVRFEFGAETPRLTRGENLVLPALGTSSTTDEGDVPVFRRSQARQVGLREAVVDTPIGGFDPPPARNPSLGTRQGVVGRVVFDRGIARPGDRVRLPVRFSPDPLAENGRPRTIADVNASVLFEVRRVPYVIIRAYDLVYGVLRGEIKLAQTPSPEGERPPAGGETLRIAVRHLCADQFLRECPDLLAQSGLPFDDLDFFWHYGLSRAPAQEIQELARPSSYPTGPQDLGHRLGLPIPSRLGDPQSACTSRCGTCIG